MRKLKELIRHYYRGDALMRGMNALGRYLAKHRSSALGMKLDQFITGLYRGIRNYNYRFDTNGEAWVLNVLGTRIKTKVVFDVGANHGDWALLASQYFPDANVYSFEIVPESFEHLRSNVEDCENIMAHSIGLYDHEGEIDVYFDDMRPKLATTVEGFSNTFFKEYRAKKLTLPVTTGDCFCKDHGIDHIDFLKIDAEGAEPNVIRGLSEMLAAGKVDVIQFEYGFISIKTRFLLLDYYELLSRYNMLIGKIYPKHVEFKKYDYFDEDFIGPNFLAVKSDRQDIVELLQRN